MNEQLITATDGHLVLAQRFGKSSLWLGAGEHAHWRWPVTAWMTRRPVPLPCVVAGFKAAWGVGVCDHLELQTLAGGATSVETTRADAIIGERGDA